MKQATRLRSLAGGLLGAGLAALLAAACDHSPGTPSSSDPLERAASGITQERIAEHVGYLASDAMRGRLTPSWSLEAAAAYLVENLGKAGLAPGGDQGDFRQHFPCTSLVESRYPSNIVALLRGSDPRLASEWVVVSAHYDHVGVGLPDALDDSIYNGADDNASGTAALLEVARAFASLPKAPARSLAFVAVSGEEEWLVGSTYFVAHWPAALGQIVANVNLDMLGRNEPELIYFIGGQPLIRRRRRVGRVAAAPRAEAAAALDHAVLRQQR